MEFLIIIGVFAVMMWLMSRGGRRQRDAQAQFLKSLETGQSVMTHSGFFGTIVDIDGDAITLESAPGVETLWKREAIKEIGMPPFAVEEDDEDAESIEIPDDAAALLDSGDASTGPEPSPGADASPVEDGDAPEDAGAGDDEPRTQRRS